ncbi:MAG: helix-turn-helix domain-containing protein [Christensenellales bacterium]
MEIGNVICKLRTEAKLTQAQFAEITGVSQQSIQKWESGVATPDLNKIVAISRYFDVSLDALILGNDNRVVEEMNRTSVIKPQYQNLHDWEFYSANIQVEYAQSTDEGLDVERYEDIFNAVARLPKGEIKKKFGDILFDVVLSAPKKRDTSTSNLPNSIKSKNFAKARTSGSLTTQTRSRTRFTERGWAESADACSEKRSNLSKRTNLYPSLKRPAITRCTGTFTAPTLPKKYDKYKYRSEPSLRGRD